MSSARSIHIKDIAPSRKELGLYKVLNQGLCDRKAAGTVVQGGTGQKAGATL